jgi:Arc/MetJ-type ribon-helix-helix transcriptional regulator
MKLSVSLPAEDIEFLDAYARNSGVDSRSAALHRAVRLLRATELTGDYEDAWKEWASSDDAAAWDATSPDGLATDASR